MAKDAKGHGSEGRGGSSASSSFKPGDRVMKTMGVRGSGVVTKSFPLSQANDGTYASPAMGKVPVQWDDGTKGYEHSQHLGPDVAAASALAQGNPKAGAVPIHDGASGRSDWAEKQAAVAQESSRAQNMARGSNPNYSRDAVNNAIASSNRSGRRIGGKEASAIHRLLSGR